MSNTSFGKIILFRIEDLQAEDPVAYQPILSQNELLNTFSEEQLDLLEQVGISTDTPLPFDLIQGGGAALSTANDAYRISTKNYRLINNGKTFTSERFDTFFRGDVERKNLILDYFTTAELEDPNILYFRIVKYGIGENAVTISPVESNTAIGNTNSYVIAGNQSFEPANAPFLNHNLSIVKPNMSSESSNEDYSSFGVGDSLRVVPIYNYYLKEYEQFYQSLATKVDFDIDKPEEKSIPNFYYLISLLADPSIFELTNVFNKTAESMSGILKDIALDPQVGSSVATETLVFEQQAIERNSVVVVTPSFYKDLAEEIASQRTQHPFYNEIRIPIQKGGTVVRDVLKQRGLYDQLQYRAGTAIKILNKAVRNGLNVSDVLADYDMFYNVPVPDEPYANEIIDAKQRKLYMKDIGVPYSADVGFPISLTTSKIPKLLEFDLQFNTSGQDFNFKVDSSTSPYLKLKNVSRHGQNGYILNTPNGKTDAFGLNLNFAKSSPIIENVNNVSAPLTFYSKALDCGDNPSGGQQIPIATLLNLIYNSVKLKTYAIFDNTKNYSEILFFEVQKFDAVTNELIQTFILPNDPDIGDFVTYIDSQIKYSKGYIYTVYAHTISIGNKVRRSEFLQQFPGEKDITLSPLGVETVIAKFSYENDVDVKLIRVPYYNTEELLHPVSEKQKITFNIDSPPIPPNLLFYPFKNVSNKLGFWFNIGIGELRMVPELFLNTGLQNKELQKYYFVMQQLYNDVTSASSILYKTDDFGGKIEVYRTTTRPETYADFRGNKIADIDVLGSRSLIDDIIPNQDYYYTFKHIDVHDLPSNPTPVYHLKMITSDSPEEAGSVRVGVDGLNPVLFSEIIPIQNKLEDKKVEKSFKKYLLIEPSLSQTYLSFDNFENGDVTSGFSTAEDIKVSPQELKIGKGGDDFIPVDGKKFKIRVTSKQTGRKIDLNVDFKNLSIIENYEE